MPVRPIRRRSRRTGRTYTAGYRIGKGKAVYPTKAKALEVQRAIKARQGRQGR